MRQYWGAARTALDCCLNFAARQGLYRAIEKDRGTKVLAFVTGDRVGLQTIIANDAIEPFVTLLDEIGPTKKISLILDTNGGSTSAAWRLINLLRSFADELEVMVPTKAMSAGTLMALGADSIVMTKQAALGPIDPSLDNHPLNPTYGANNAFRMAVSAEAVRGYIEEVKKDVSDPTAIAAVWTHLATAIHPIVLGEIFRLGGQIRSMAKALIVRQVPDKEAQEKIINLLCSDSGSHDYTISRRYAAEIGLKIEKPSDDLYSKLTDITKSYHGELQTLQPFSLGRALGQNQQSPYLLVRGLIESTEGGCYGFISEGTVVAPVAPSTQISDLNTFTGWRKLP